MIKKTQEIIFEVIVGEDQLTSIKIHNLLKKKQYSKSYQNTYKILNEMVEDGILHKNSNEYQINKDWLKKRIQKLTDYQEKEVSNIQNIYSDNKLKIYNINSLYELDEFWIDYVLKEIETNKGIKEVFWEGPNCWWLFSSIIEEEMYLDKLRNNNIEAYFIIKKNNILNLRTKNFYNERNCNSKICTNLQNPYLHRGIIGNKIIEVEYGDDVNNIFDEIYESRNSDIFLDKMRDIINLKINLKIKITTDNHLSSVYSKKLKSEIEKDGEKETLMDF